MPFFLEKSENSNLGDDAILTSSGRLQWFYINISIKIGEDQI